MLDSDHASIALAREAVKPLGIHLVKILQAFLTLEVLCDYLAEHILESEMLIGSVLICALCSSNFLIIPEQDCNVPESSTCGL
jgi:hypothetical protein